ncbi:MAG TPA: exonuclease SbcCD subunit D C-terminal domain-containing protein [Planctomycetota bacterium]|nr:exonuclease SbcCD subunit D C-terminal domain-containing protein [Planctomycetota bacterium]
MRVIHTADWHLGHTLHELSREYEQRSFLEWLLKVLPKERIDALIVAGDVFDTANPPAAAQRMWFEFVCNARRKCPKLQIVVVGGNHDSAERLDAPEPLFRELGVHVIGGLPRRQRGTKIKLDFERMIVPLKDERGEVEAIVAAVPFVRPSDVPEESEGEGLFSEPALIAGIRTVYEQVIAAAKAKKKGSEALIATGHCYVAGGQLSELSERKIQSGNQHALPLDIFLKDVAYVALGHLHCPQDLDKGRVRYCGSPIPLAMNEAAYAHSVTLLDIEGGRVKTSALEVPRKVELMTVPESAKELSEVLPLLKALPVLEITAKEEARPFLEVRVSLPQFEPGLRRQIEQALEGRAPRLVKITVQYTGTGVPLAESETVENLAELEPEEVFRRCYERQYKQPPPEEWLFEFRNLIERAQHGADVTV